MKLEEYTKAQLAASEFYKRFIKNHGTTIVAASKEPLKLRDLQSFEERKVTLPTGKQVRSGEAFCYYCLEDLISRYNRPKKPDKYELADMAETMIKLYPDWSVMDLPTFVQMVVLARVPSLYSNGSEYQLIILDEGNIMGKVESYNQMRPNKPALQGMSPVKTGEREWDPNDKHTRYMLTHLFDGTPFKWESVEACRKYWSLPPDLSNPAEKAAIDRAGVMMDGCVQRVGRESQESTEGVL